MPQTSDNSNQNDFAIIKQKRRDIFMTQTPRNLPLHCSCCRLSYWHRSTLTSRRVKWSCQHGLTKQDSSQSWVSLKPQGLKCRKAIFFRSLPVYPPFRWHHFGFFNSAMPQPGAYPYVWCQFWGFITNSFLYGEKTISRWWAPSCYSSLLRMELRVWLFPANSPGKSWLKFAPCSAQQSIIDFQNIPLPLFIKILSWSICVNIGLYSVHLAWRMKYVGWANLFPSIGKTIPC